MPGNICSKYYTIRLNVYHSIYLIFAKLFQWFIDHADLIILVYDYAKLDIGPETEALLDQLKGRESQVRIVLNKADEITAEELLKIQGNLVWNVSPLMASVEPPTLYAGSFWSKPYQVRANCTT